MERRVYLKVLDGYRPLFLKFCALYGMPVKVVRVSGNCFSGFIYCFKPSVFKSLGDFDRLFRVEYVGDSVVFIQRSYGYAFLGWKD